MERLTNRITAEKYKVGYYGDIDKSSEIYIRLAEYENFMEEYNLNFEQLKQIINWLSQRTGKDAELMEFICQERKEIFDRDKQLLEENQILKNRWENLKCYINQFKEYNIDEANMAWKITDKMQELIESN